MANITGSRRIPSLSFAAKHPIKIKPKIVYVDMDDVLCDFSTAFNQCLLENPGIRFPQSQYGFYRNLAPIPDGLKSVRQHFDKKLEKRRQNRKL